MHEWTRNEANTDNSVKQQIHNVPTGYTPPYKIRSTPSTVQYNAVLLVVLGPVG
jgi:hypothetical protein